METQNKMGTAPVGRLLVGVSMPIVISMLVQAMYNVVDSIFVAMVSENALTAVSLIFPVQNLMIAVAVGTGVGINSLLARRLGEKNFDSANRTASNGIFITVLSWVVFALMGIAFTNAFLSFSAPLPADASSIEYANMLEIRAMGASYMRIVTIFSLGIFMSITLERLLQATGRSVFSMVSQLVGALTNIILDPILIFGLFGLPAMGVTGAAVATVIGQFFGMFVGLFFNFAKNHDIKIKVKGFRPSAKTIKHIYQVGLPSIVMQSIGSVMVVGMNVILNTFSTTAVAVFGVYFKLQSFVFMPAMGFNTGMVPIVAYNYGARQRLRIQRTVKVNAIVCFGIMLCGTLLFNLAPGWLLSFFNPEPEMLNIGIKALRVISLSWPSAAICITFSSTFQALAKGTYSLMMSAVRQLVFLLPAAWLLSRISGLHTVWYAFLIAEFACLVLGILLFVRLWNTKIKPLDET